MTRRLLPLAAAAAAALALAGTAAAAAVQVSGVDLSGYPEVRVSVEAPLGSPQPQLTENGAPVSGLVAANLGSAKSVVLAVDRSESMAGRPLRDATDAARAFVAAKGAADRLEVIAFGRNAVALTRFSSVAADADAALAGLVADGRSGTALWDAVVQAAHGLRGPEASGRVILVVTDGRDVSSSASFAQAVAAAHAARAAVYAIGIEGPEYTPAPLRALAAETGGAYLAAASTAQLASLYASIGRTLARTWQLRYVTSARPGETIRVAASLPSGRATRTLVLPADGLAAAPVGGPSTLLPRSAWTSSLGALAVSLAVGLLVLAACGFAVAARSGSRLRARIAPHVDPIRPAAKVRRRREGRTLLRRLFSVTESAFSDSRRFQALQRLLTRADLPLLAAELLYVCLGVGVLGAAFAALLGLPPLLVLLVAAGSAALPLAWAARKAQARMKAFDNQLPDLLITIAASLKAGHSFRYAIQAVVDEGAEPAAKEFRRVLSETRLGRPMDEALAEMGERIGSRNLSFVLTSVSIQRQIGGSLAGLFDMVAETVRQRQQFSRKIRSLTAMGRMSAYVLGGLPFCVAVLISVISPSYMAPLWHTSTGHQLVGVGIGMLAFGAVLLRRIVSFKG